MAKVLLVQPMEDRKSGPKKIGIHIPISILYLGTAIKDKHDVKLFDRNLYPEDRHILRLINNFKPDIIGFTSMTSPMLLDIDYLGKIIKRQTPKSLIVLGGVHATIDPDSCLNETYVDYIIRGEGEDAFLEFCKNYKNPKKLEELENVNKNPMRKLMNLNDLKLPDYSLLELKKYDNVWIPTSRGCPGNCSFCYNAKMWGVNGKPMVRFQSIEKTKELFKEAIENYGITEFTLADDNFVTYKKLCIDVCNFLYNKYHGKISFYVSARADKVDKEILTALRRAGCNTIQYGTESGSQRVLDFLNKGESVETQARAIILARKCKIFNCSSFMIGIPTETVAEMYETVRFIKKYKPDIADVKFFQVLPGNKIFDDLTRKGKIESPKNLIGWAEWNQGLKALHYNFSEIPDKTLKETVHSLWRYRLIRTKIKKSVWWIKKGKFKYVLKRLKRLIPA